MPRIGFDALASVCTLNAPRLRDRLAWIAALNAAGLRSYRRQGDRIVLTYAPAVADEVRELVARERECCATFLDVALEEREDAVVLTIRAPAGLGAAADALFAPSAAEAPPARRQP